MNNGRTYLQTDFNAFCDSEQSPSEYSRSVDRQLGRMDMSRAAFLFSPIRHCHSQSIAVTVAAGEAVNPECRAGVRMHAKAHPPRATGEALNADEKKVTSTLCGACNGVKNEKTGHEV